MDNHGRTPRPGCCRLRAPAHDEAVHLPVPTPHLRSTLQQSSGRRHDPTEDPEPELNKPPFPRSRRMSKSYRAIPAAAVMALLAAVALSPTASFSEEATAKMRAGTLTCQGEGPGRPADRITGKARVYVCAVGQPTEASTCRDGHEYRSRCRHQGTECYGLGVLGSTTALPTDALRGSFVGAAADASLARRAGAKVLVGGSNKSVVLQPLSVQGQTGSQPAQSASLVLGSIRADWEKSYRAGHKPHQARLVLGNN